VIVLYDIFNQKVISRHKTIEAAGKANERFQKAVKKANGSSSYIPVDIRIETKEGLAEFEPDSVDYLYWLVKGWEQ
jgi:hypothetical protein